MEGIKQVGFANPDGGYVVVLANPGAATEVSLMIKRKPPKSPLQKIPYHL